MFPVPIALGMTLCDKVIVEKGTDKVVDHWPVFPHTPGFVSQPCSPVLRLRDGDLIAQQRFEVRDL